METQYFNNLDYQKKIFFDLLSGLEEEKSSVLKEAFLFAEEAHSNQIREESEKGVPYIIHPVRMVIYLLRDLQVSDVDLVVAALFHDVVEDTRFKIEDIEERFGKRVAELVEHLTRRRQAGETEEEKREAKKKKFEELMMTDKDVRLAKCSDLLDNMRAWPYIPIGHPTRKKFPRWLEEAEKYYIPLAQKTDERIVIDMKKALDNV